MKRLIVSWRSKLDRRAQERRLNELPQFITRMLFVDG
ncbi:MAG: hypothetical protein EOP67_13960 [Sphingomonas sp.]|nr:MAG: hypothetical protein EOP67_13960 [Sphingomonas sp.]